MAKALATRQPTALRPAAAAAAAAPWAAGEVAVLERRDAWQRLLKLAGAAARGPRAIRQATLPVALVIGPSDRPFPRPRLTA